MPRRPGQKFPSDATAIERKRIKRARIRAGIAARETVEVAPAPKRAYTRRAPPPPRAPAAPELGRLVDEVVAELADVAGGSCPTCSKAHSDEDRNCRFCGSMLRRACKCGRLAADGVRFCTACGSEVPELRKAAQLAAAAASSSSSPDAPPPAPLAPLEPEDLWEPDDVTWFAAGIDAILMKMDAPLLDEKERARIDKRTAVMANKYFRPGARWKDEVLWVAAWGKPLVMAAYIRYVVMPDRERERAASAKLEAPAPIPPPPPAVPVAADAPSKLAVNLESVK
jgi:hypothetical protein